MSKLEEKIGRQKRGRMLFENGNLSRFDAPVAMSINQPLLRLPVLHLRYAILFAWLCEIFYIGRLFLSKVSRKMIMIS